MTLTLKIKSAIERKLFIMNSKGEEKLFPRKFRELEIVCKYDYSLWR